MLILNFLNKYTPHIYLLALLPLLSLGMMSGAIIVFVFFSFFFFFLNKNYEVKKLDWKLFFIFTIPFLFYLIALLWTDNFLTGIKFIEKTLSFLVIPLSFFIFKPFTAFIQFKRFTHIYILSCVFLTLFTGVYIMFNISGICSQNNEYQITVSLRSAIELVPIIGEHAIYFSLILAVGLLVLFYNRFESKILNVLFCFLLISGLILASSKGVIIAIIIVSILMIFQNNKNKKKSVFLFFSFIIGISTVIYFSPLKSRINEITETNHFYPKGIHYNSINLRMAIYNCSFSLIKEAGFFGFSPADMQQKLNTCYEKFNTTAFKDLNYNTHNQYLDYLLSFGVIGLLSILFVFYYYLKLALKNSNKLHFNFLILFYIAFLTENILIRNTGIVLFTSFNCLFAYSLLLKKN